MAKKFYCDLVYHKPIGLLAANEHHYRANGFDTREEAQAYFDSYRTRYGVPETTLLRLKEIGEYEVSEGTEFGNGWGY